ncbi:hypothetical protein KY346_00685 [Candidatus Woesearchaeota archaeon]|nr:hypothetical protein [Candidatus Woesearchaeota archaeon]
MIESFKNFLCDLNKVEAEAWLDFKLKKKSLEAVQTILRIACLKQTGKLEYKFLPDHLQEQAERFKFVFLFHDLEQNCKCKDNSVYNRARLEQAKKKYFEEYKKYCKIKEELT